MVRINWKFWHWWQAFKEWEERFLKPNPSDRLDGKDYWIEPAAKHLWEVPLSIHDDWAEILDALSVKRVRGRYGLQNRLQNLSMKIADLENDRARMFSIDQLHPVSGKEVEVEGARYRVVLEFDTDVGWLPVASMGGRRIGAINGALGTLFRDMDFD